MLDTYGTLPNQGTGTANNVPVTWTLPLSSAARVNDVIAAADTAGVSTNAS